MDVLKESIEVKADEGEDRHDVGRYDFESARKVRDEDNLINMLQTDQAFAEEQEEDLGTKRP